MNQEIKLITRADDLGSTHSTNLAIEKAIANGFIKNVSVMAVGLFVEEAAEMFAKRNDICFGLHAAINSEWDQLKWGPVSDPSKVPSLVTDNGWFYPRTLDFYFHPPVIVEIMLEMQAQLDKLLHLGFNIRYVDFHMAPGRYVPSLGEAMREWAAKNSLINIGVYGTMACFYRPFPLYDEISMLPGAFESVLKKLPAGQYIYVGHPALDTEETRLCGEYNAYRRNKDTEFVSSPETMRLCEKYHVTPIRIDQAEAPIVPVV
ncbi:hypothetical protein SD70_00880 [Gordoniibacillus kamchatkensis]|uniref:ChbG/HpnK family deacetylase n=1 Tax=Gordoniibacillus kamchatkensis TaxID=1590651 RepID=A0ABR5ANR1_9BACL|nr:ChbG/HpnK family deacetylase [Paenibacillus sp. VKM B-2647]KIL42483.1 hypothetical protein SD70_00880 [Paenibacillus sp. VKM B-2647]